MSRRLTAYCMVACTTPPIVLGLLFANGVCRGDRATSTEHAFIDRSGRIVGPAGFSYPAKPDGTPLYPESGEAYRLRGRRWTKEEIKNAGEAALSYGQALELEQPMPGDVPRDVYAKYSWVEKGENGLYRVTTREMKRVDYGTGEHAGWFEGPAKGFINQEGVEVIPPVFSRAGSFRDGLALAVGLDRRTGKRCAGLINEKGEFVAVKAEWRDLSPSRTGLSAVSVKSSRGGSCWGFVDSRGQWRIRPKFDQAQGFSDGLAAVRVGEKWGYIDEDGDMVIRPQFGFVGPFFGGYAKIDLD